MHPVQAPFLLLLLVLLPLATHCQVFGVPTVNLDAVHDNTTGNVIYLAKLKLAIPPAVSHITEAEYLLDTNAQYTVLSFNCTRTTTKAELWALAISQSGIVGSMSDSSIGNISVICKKKHGKNIAALSSKQSSLPLQVAANLESSQPHAFAYRLVDQSGGTVFFGRSSWVQYSWVELGKTEDVVFVIIPFKPTLSGGYLLELTGVGSKSSLTSLKVNMVMSTTERFTALPSKVYSFLLAQFEGEVAQKKITPALVSYGKLGRCYNMKTTDVSGLGNVTMTFSGKYKWNLAGKDYLVQKPGSDNVYCFAFLKAATANAGIIGTLQQLGRVINYDLPNQHPKFKNFNPNATVQIKCACHKGKRCGNALSLTWPRGANLNRAVSN